MKEKLQKIFLLLFLTFGVQLNAASLKTEIVNGYNSGLRYSLVPWLKEYIYLKRGNIGNVDKIVTNILLRVGAQNFEGLDIRLLANSGANSLRYVAAKKYVKKSEFSKARTVLTQISKSSLLFPLAQNFLATISYLKKDYERSLNYYSICLESSQDKMNSGNQNVFKQLKINRDICITGKARVHYAKKELKKADDAYLNLEKKSIVWPPILLEEAWSSYYAGHYNRTLGKLVTYNAPLLKYVSNPEVYVLKAMTYLKMCLYGDVNKVAEDFYGRYENLASALEQEVKRNKDSLYYYHLVSGFKNESPEERMYILKGIKKSPNVKVFFENIENAKKEKSLIARHRGNRKGLYKNISEFVETQKKVIGLHAQTRLNKTAYDLRKSLQSMSYMKLEVLGRKKEALYEGKPITGKRGDVKYLKKSDRQYFWNFIGEFWGDELGDYVFTLPVECPDYEK